MESCIRFVERDRFRNIGASINTQKTGLAAGKYRVHLSGKIYDSDNRLVETVSRDSVQKTVY